MKHVKAELVVRLVDCAEDGSETERGSVVSTVDMALADGLVIKTGGLHRGIMACLDRVVEELTKDAKDTAEHLEQFHVAKTAREEAPDNLN